jgi:hypothetical protein
MKYATFEHGGRERVGLVDTAAGRIHPLDVDGMIALLGRPAGSSKLTSYQCAATTDSPAGQSRSWWEESRSVVIGPARSIRTRFSSSLGL